MQCLTCPQMVILLTHNQGFHFNHVEPFIFCQVGFRLPPRHPLSLRSLRVNSLVVNILSFVIAQPRVMDTACSLSWTHVVRAGFPWSILNLKPYLVRQSAWENTFLFTVLHMYSGRDCIRRRITHTQSSWLMSNTFGPIWRWSVSLNGTLRETYEWIGITAFLFHSSRFFPAES